MWLPAGLVLWGLAARAFFRWFHEERGPRPGGATVGMVLLALVCGTAGCQSERVTPAVKSVEKPSEDPQQKPAETGDHVSPWLFSTGGKYKVRFHLPKDLPLNELIEPVVEVTDLQGKIIPSLVIKADATMPEHGHGMMTQPRPKNCAPATECQGPDGRYTFEGFRLHMPGSWLFQVELGKNDRATWRYDFDPDF